MLSQSLSKQETNSHKRQNQTKIEFINAKVTGIWKVLLMNSSISISSYLSSSNREWSLAMRCQVCPRRNPQVWPDGWGPQRDAEGANGVASLSSLVPLSPETSSSSSFSLQHLHSLVQLDSELIYKCQVLVLQTVHDSIQTNQTHLFVDHSDLSVWFQITLQ